jgi:hypothetical protein
LTKVSTWPLTCSPGCALSSTIRRSARRVVRAGWWQPPDRLPAIRARQLQSGVQFVDLLFEAFGLACRHAHGV